ncbi:N-acetyltransferase [Streptomyces sp. NBC_00199]|uniref:N-acetyltransferase n=1 Tax=Streptomyces sp. NBC_00199 TaxID=2975678 RepID=UPI002259FA36|nr:N-acetyltransferase [Streptomyces sp. NBC_00199]MCX5264777.1 N-acetyltransferase [Streptomyces sp. NBC_00199]
MSPQGPDEECLLLVHVRKVVGQVTYRVCGECADGVITEVVLDEPFRTCGLGTRALSHLRARYPELTWRTTLDTRLTRDLMHRLRIPRAAAAVRCSHVGSPAAGHHQE